MNEKNLRENETCSHSSKCMSWTAIFAGALVAVGLSFLLNIFGAAIGLSTLTTSAEGATTIAIGGYLGLLVGTIAIMFFAGWIAGYLNRKYCCNRNIGALYGFTTWCLALIITMLIAAHTVQFISANVYTISNRKVNTNLSNHNVIGKKMTNDAGYSNSNRSKADQVNADDEAVVEILTLSLLLTFILFFAGAIASAIGGCCGLKPKDSTCCNKTNSSCG